MDRGYNYFTWIDEEYSRFTDSKFQPCGLQKTLLGRLDVLEHNILMKNAFSLLQRKKLVVYL